jgi:hypothetical protein
VCDTGDRRRVLVELTELADRRATELHGPIVEAGQTGLERYTADQLALLRNFLRRGRTLYEERTAQISCRARN